MNRDTFVVNKNVTHRMFTHRLVASRVVKIRGHAGLRHREIRCLSHFQILPLPLISSIYFHCRKGVAFAIDALHKWGESK